MTGCPGLPGVKPVIWMNLHPKYITLNGQPAMVTELIQSAGKKDVWEKEWLDFLAEWYAPADFIEVDTSGSTGVPKTIRLKKSFVAASAQRTIRFFDLKENDRILHCLPSRYIAGKLMVVRALLAQLDLHVVDPSTDFSFLQTRPFKFAAMVPNQAVKMLEFASGIPVRGPQFLLIGGGALPQLLEEQLQHVSISCYSSYAMTETATHIALRKINGSGADRFYHCLEDIQVQLSNDGCLQIIMPGLEQAYLQTTDFAELKDRRTFRILGRADHVVISGGMKFFPEQLERKLDPYVMWSFMISSIPHESLGQQLVLVVEGNEDAETIARLKTICRQQLNKYEQPRQIRFVQKLPRTENGKLRRF